MNCTKCGARCQGGLCRQCEIERQFEDQANELADADLSEDTEADDA